VDAAQIQQKIETEIYRGWEPLFKRIRLYPHAAKTLAALKESGFKLGLLSDFPPDRKLENLGIAGIWDAVLCSEKEQALKPDRLPFDKLAAALGLESGKILYVGNSLRYDVLGAKRAGMGAALVCSSLKALRRNRASQIEDFAFHDYRQLLKYVLS
jgi:putative hydrolase of the HAD superfamily